MPELELIPDEAGNLEEVVHQQEDQQLIVEESPDEVIEVTQPGLGGEPSLGDSHQGGARSTPPVTPPDDSSAYEDPDWEGEYVKCPRWSELWKYRMQPEGVWPENVKFSGPYLLTGYKVAVPTGLQSIIIRKHHSFLAHAGFARLWHHMDLKYTWADRAAAKNLLSRLWGSVLSVRLVTDRLG